MIVTQHHNPPGGDESYNNRPIGVRYEYSTGRWHIFNTSGNSIAPGVGFNIHIANHDDTPAQAEDLVTNGGFEVTTSVPKIPSDWNVANVGTGSKRVCNKYFPASPTTKIYSYSGECAYKLIGALGQTRKLVQPLTISAQNTASVSAWVKGVNLTGARIVLKLTLDDTTSMKLTIPGTDLAGSFDYKQVEKSSAIPVGRSVVAGKLTIQISNGSGALFIDDVQAYVGNFAP
jgi:hypothetical protein